MSIMKIIKSNAGDTIVEVLIAIVILSLILTGAYVSANDSLTNIRDAQERIQALGYAQSQAEDLRSEAAQIFSSSGNNLTYLSQGSFCFDASNNFTTWPGNPTGFTSCNFGTIPYTVHISAKPNPPGDQATTTTFEIVVNWPSISHEISTAQLAIYYRVVTQ